MPPEPAPKQTPTQRCAALKRLLAEAYADKAALQDQLNAARAELTRASSALHFAEEWLPTARFTVKQCKGDFRDRIIAVSSFHCAAARVLPTHAVDLITVQAGKMWRKWHEDGRPESGPRDDDPEVEVQA